MKSPMPKQIERGLRELSEEQPDLFQLERNMARIKQDDKSRRIGTMRTARTTLIGAGVVAVLFIALLLIPATYTQTVGSVVTFSFAGVSLEDASAIGDLLETVEGVEKTSVMMKSTDEMQQPELQFNVSMDETNPSDARESVEETLVSAGYRPASIDSKPVKIEIGGNALAAITGGVIRINTTGMSDTEIEQAITNALLGEGMTDVQVDVQTGDGQREINIEMQKELAPGEEMDEPVEIQLDDDAFGGEGERVERRVVREEE